MNKTKFIIYGAEARPRPVPPLAERLRLVARRGVHGFLDRRQFRAGSLARLDYRNYLGQDSINLGDVAIAQSAAAFYKPLAGAPLTFLNWGELDSMAADAGPATVVFAGSGYFIVSKTGRLAPRLEHDLRALKRTGGRAIFLGVGVNLPSATHDAPPACFHPEDAACVSRLLSHADAISVRDAASLALLSPLAPQPVHLVGDPALHFCALHGMGEREPAPARARPVIGLNFSFHGPVATELLRKNLDAYVTALKTLQQETGGEFCYFVHFKTGCLLPKLLAMRGLSVKVVAGDTATLARGYGDLDLHIGGMLHSCILATSAGTPCIGLAYDIKHQGFFDLMGLPENCLPAANFAPEALLERARALLAGAQPVREHIRHRRSALEAATLAFVQQSMAAVPPR